MIVPLIAALLLQAGLVPASPTPEQAQGPASPVSQTEQAPEDPAQQTEQAASNPTPTQDISACAGSVVYVYPQTYSLDSWGPSLHRYTIVFVAEGFTDSAKDILLYEQKVVEAIDYLSNAPFARCAFNVYSVRLKSNESGSDHPMDCPPTYKDTPLNSQFGDSTPGSENHDERFLLLDVHDRAAAQAAASCATDNYDQVVVLVNDPAYGGMHYSHEGLVTVSIGQGFENVLIHEMGHAFAALGDEYSGDLPYPQGWMIDEPNLTTVIQRDQPTKWRVDALVPIPTDLNKLRAVTAFANLPECDLKAMLGLWEGAAGFQNSVYRPEFTCRMRDARKVFCKVCTKCIATIAKAKCDSRPTLFVPALGAALKCMAGVLVRIPLPPCLKCLTAVGSNEIAGVELSGPDMARIDIGPLPGVEKVHITTVDAEGQSIVVATAERSPAGPSSLEDPGAMFSVTFEIEPGAHYTIEFCPASCAASDFAFSVRLFVNGEEVGLL